MGIIATLWCPVNFLIDGYNLMHAVGWAPPGKSPGTLEPARKKLLDWLADAAPFKAGNTQFRVVFDAQNGPAPSVGRSHRGVLVQFAYKKTADDVIEELLEAETAPKKLVVVSNDTRLHDSATRSGAKGWGCTEFLDWLIARAKETPGNIRFDPPEKPDGPEETGDLLAVFSRPKPRR